MPNCLVDKICMVTFQKLTFFWICFTFTSTAQLKSCHPKSKKVSALPLKKVGKTRNTII
jgi:hypothetical protein